MAIRLLADLVLILHFAFIVFVLFGGFLLLRRRSLWIIHLPAVVWGALIQYFMWSCPLTYLESYLRETGGGEGYQTGFIEYYVTTLVYPEITPEMHFAAGAFLIVLNLAIYILIFRLKYPLS